MCSLYRPIGIEELILGFSFTVILGKGLTHLIFEMFSDSYLLLTLPAFLFSLRVGKKLLFPGLKCVS